MTEKELEIEENFPYEQLFRVKTQLPWYADLINYLACGIMPQEFTYQLKKKLRYEAIFYIWDDPLLFRRGADQIIRRCVPETEQVEILDKCHSAQYGGHFVRQRIAQKILQSGFYWPTLFRDIFEWVKQCDGCQRVRNINKRNEMPLQGILVVQIFDVWGINFMGTLSTIFWEYIYSSCYGLCIQMNRSYCLSKK